MAMSWMISVQFPSDTGIFLTPHPGYLSSLQCTEKLFFQRYTSHSVKVNNYLHLVLMS